MNNDFSDAKAFLFDLDGVVVDSERVYTDIWRRIDGRFPTGVPDFALKIKGTTLPDILSTYFPDPEAREGARRMLLELEEEMQFPVIPGALDLLTRLRDKGVPTALVTSSMQVKMQRLWSQHPQLKDFFSVIITADDVSRSKPDPQGYLLAAEALGADPAECVVVEDSLQGVQAGRNAGARVIGVPGTLPAETLAPFADALAPDLSEIRLW